MIDQVINQQLKQKYAGLGSELQKHQSRLLEILIYIDEICRQNGIEYWLSSGTALGAVRHGGFIPWDDDVDIEMTWSDYKRFERIMINDEYYDLQSRTTDVFYAAPYAKVRDRFSAVEERLQDLNYKFKGVYVDVFIIEKSPSLLISALFSRVVWGLVKESGKANSPVKRVCFRMNKAVTYAIITLVRYIFLLLPSKTYRHTLGSGFNKNIRYIDEILPTKDVFFEGYSFKIAKDYDAYLRRIYGDYMSLPNPDSIHPHVSKVVYFDQI